MAVGAMIAMLSGLCSGLYLISSLIAAFKGGVGNHFGGVGFALVFGGLPFLVGLAIFFVGRNIYRLQGR